MLYTLHIQHRESKIFQQEFSSVIGGRKAGERNSPNRTERERENGQVSFVWGDRYRWF